ncbi:hypothetical protein [Photorhabdus sp. RM323S]|uniref:hypothetical protein n=1 Tax=Photorhabdus sp. RM323S TaxID=3342828 RepID=UPI0036DF3F8B
MNEKFIWFPDENQLYSHEYGTQSIPPLHSFNKTLGFTFTMDAGEHKLTLDTTDNTRNNKGNNINWPFSPLIELNESDKAYKSENTDEIPWVTITISSGNLIISGSKEKPVNFYLNNEIFLFNYKNRIELQNSSTFTIENAGVIGISTHTNNDKNTAPIQEKPTVDISGKSCFKIQQVPENIENFISLNCYFSITESAQASLESHIVSIGGGSIILQDNAQMLISSQVLDINNKLDKQDPSLPSTNFILKAGDTSLNLNSLDGINFPLDIYREDYPKGMFNFMAKGEKNTGKVVIDVAPKDANAYGLNTMLRKNFTAINGKMVETGDQMKYFDFNYGQDTRKGNQVGTITISLRNPLLHLS